MAAAGAGAGMMMDARTDNPRAEKRKLEESSDRAKRQKLDEDELEKRVACLERNTMKKLMNKTRPYEVPEVLLGDHAFLRGLRELVKDRLEAMLPRLIGTSTAPIEIINSEVCHTYYGYNILGSNSDACANLKELIHGMKRGCQATLEPLDPAMREKLLDTLTPKTDFRVSADVRSHQLAGEEFQFTVEDFARVAGTVFGQRNAARLEAMMFAHAEHLGQQATAQTLLLAAKKLHEEGSPSDGFKVLHTMALAVAAVGTEIFKMNAPSVVGTCNEVSITIPLHLRECVDKIIRAGY